MRSQKSSLIILALLVLVFVIFLLSQQIHDTGHAYKKNPYCGNLNCEWWESSSTCPQDCEKLQPLAVPEDKFTKVFEPASNPLMFSISKDSIAIKEITLTLAQNASRAQVTFQIDNSLPRDSSTVVYQSINTTNYNLQNLVQKAELTFAVEKKWIVDNKVSEKNIILSYWNDGLWQPVPTVLIQQDSFYYYRSVIPTLAAMQISVREPQVERPSPQTENSNTTSVQESGKAKIDLKLFMYIGLAALVGLFIAVLIYHNLKKE